MILTFAEVITPDELRAILAAAANAEFVDGRETAGAALAETKRNEQIKRGSSAIQPITDILLGALKRRPEFLSATYPRQLHSTLVSRYRPGMHYGAHVDQALMGEAPLWRTDLSLTLFLNSPEEYDGGELVLESGNSESRVKLPARALVCYPTGQLHRVEPVTRGERRVVVSWIQSHVREPAAREILRDLALAREALAGREDLRAAWDRVNKTHTNLLRRWAES
jgi:PKHD-type hydroxylase